ncbi:MAG: hypothetical protein AAF579_11470 [Cyanobacteria bacterium P01_C01_bin.118]
MDGIIFGIAEPWGSLSHTGTGNNNDDRSVYSREQQSQLVICEIEPIEGVV